MTQTANRGIIRVYPQGTQTTEHETHHTTMSLKNTEAALLNNSIEEIAAAAGINDRDFHLTEIRRVKNRDKAGTVEITFIDDNTPPDFGK